jgi:hypothetical protein
VSRERGGVRGPLTIGFLYDTELNFGDADDPSGTPGAITVMARADADYGAGLPADFTGKPWEESRWLGYVIKERTIVMSKDATWRQDMDQDGTWEAARRLHTAASNNPEAATSPSLDYDVVSRYKAGSATAGKPCWPAGLASTIDTQATIYDAYTDKAASATNESLWKGAAKNGPATYAACPANPTP